MCGNNATCPAQQQTQRDYMSKTITKTTTKSKTKSTEKLEPEKQSNTKDTLILEYKLHFHRHLFYPVNELAKKMAEFRGRTSFVHSEVEFLKSVGFLIKIEVPQIDYNEIIKIASQQNLRGLPRKSRTTNKKT
jgi:hypothetical protein